jgi:hypothetical protein
VIVSFDSSDRETSSRRNLTEFADRVLPPYGLGRLTGYELGCYGDAGNLAARVPARLDPVRQEPQGRKRCARPVRNSHTGAAWSARRDDMAIRTVLRLWRTGA